MANGERKNIILYVKRIAQSLEEWISSNPGVIMRFVYFRTTGWQLNDRLIRNDPVF